MVKDLRILYQEKLRQLGSPKQLIEKVFVTKLKNSILEQVPGLCEQKKGKFVIITLNGDVGRDICEASANSMLVDGVILTKAANIIRKHLFSKTEVFDGDLSTSWGWKEEEDSFSSIWMTIEEASKVCQELVKCSCKRKCGARC